MKYLVMVIGFMLVNPVLAEDNPAIYDGPVAIRPLRVPKGYPINPPIKIPVKPEPIKTEPTPVKTPSKVATPTKVCDYQNQCYATSHVKAAVKYIPKQIPSTSEELPVTAWKNCMSQALGVYYQSHDRMALQVATNNCQVQLGSPPIALVQIRPDGRRDAGCGYWPVGSDADTDCMAGTFER